MRSVLSRHTGTLLGVLTLAVVLLLALLPGTARAQAAAVGGSPNVQGKASTAAASSGAAAHTPTASHRALRSDPAVPAVIARFAGRLSPRTRQLLVVTAATAHTSYGTVRRYALTPGGWVLRNSWPARLGGGGMVRADRRVQGTNTTPMGRFSLTETFGRKPDPGTLLPYRQVTGQDWWVEDRGSRFYNQRRLAWQGGFSLTTRGYNGSEHLRAMGRQYDYAAVIDFNRPNPVIGRGSGIFLHVSNGRSTAGCVSIGYRRMRHVLRWLDPAKSPVIVMGTTRWLRAV